MSAVVERDAAGNTRLVPRTEPTTSESGAIVAMIERAARDPSIPLDRMRELLAMRKEAIADEAREAFNNALAIAQSEMRSIVADASNPQTRSKYATYHAVDKALRPVYTKHNLVITFDTGKAEEENYVRVLCTVALGRHERNYHIDMPADGKGAKGNDVMTKTHAVGSAVTYGRRYLLLMIFNVAIGENDDDGNAASMARGEPVTPEQAKKLRDTVDTKVVGTEARLLKWAQVEKIEDIPAGRYDEAIAKLQAVQAAS